MHAGSPHLVRFDPRRCGAPYFAKIKIAHKVKMGLGFKTKSAGRSNEFLERVSGGRFLPGSMKNLVAKSDFLSAVVRPWGNSFTRISGFLECQFTRGMG